MPLLQIIQVGRIGEEVVEIAAKKQLAPKMLRMKRITETKTRSELSLAMLLAFFGVRIPHVKPLSSDFQCGGGWGAEKGWGNNEE